MPDNMYVWMDGCRGSEASTPDRDQTVKREAGDKGFCDRELRAFLVRAEHMTQRQNRAEQSHGFVILTHGPCVSTPSSCSQTSPDVPAPTERPHVILRRPSCDFFLAPRRPLSHSLIQRLAIQTKRRGAAPSETPTPDCSVAGLSQVAPDFPQATPTCSRRCSCVSFTSLAKSYAHD